MSNISSMKVYEAGGCFHPGKVVYPKGSWKSRYFPSSCYLIEHRSKGLILFDTGYSERFHETTKYFPEKFYALATKVVIDPADCLVSQLKKDGIMAKDIAYVILSHFHADHVAGVSDFPNAKIIYANSGLQKLKSFNRVRQVANGFLKKLLPSWLEERSILLETIPTKTFKYLAPYFTEAKDLWGDESMLIVDLPGHSHGHFGLYLPETPKGKIFLAADAYWLDESLREGVYPSIIANFAQANVAQYNKTFGSLVELAKARNDLHIYSCHCASSIEINQESKV